MDQADRQTNDGIPSAIELLESRLRADPRLELDGGRLRIDLSADGILTLEGDVPKLSVKRIAMQHARSVPGVPWVVDKLRVRPAEVMTDAVIREHVRRSILAESALEDCAIDEIIGEKIVTHRQPPGRDHGRVQIQVSEGIVELDGEVPTLAHRRLAVLLAWWVPGTRDVIDGLGVLSPERDSDDEITDAVRIALEKDPFVEASQVGIHTEGGVVTLLGVLPSEAQKDMAAFDAWCLSGVRDVRNRIDVGSGP